MKQTHILLLVIISLFCSSALAQTQPTFPTTQNQPGTGQQMPNQMNPLVGVWETTVTLGQGIPDATGNLYVFPNGMYREEMYVNKFAAAFWEGSYTLTPDGTLTQKEGNKSPKICLSEGQCVPNEGPSQVVSKVTLKSPNEIALTMQDPTSGQMINLTYKRIQPPTTGIPGPTTTGPTTTGPTTTGPTTTGPITGPTTTGPITGPTTTGPITGSTTTGPALTGPTTGTPVATNTFAQWVGSYTDGDLTVYLGSPQGNYMQKGDTFFQLSVQGDEQRLEGAFRTQSGDTFPIVFQRQNGQVLVISDNLNFTLTPVAPTAPAAPVNPLGN